jgi:ABC-2 type transport system permease protein
VAERLVTESITLARRSVRLTLRNVDGLITSLALPVILLLVFVYLFGGAIQTGSPYVDYVVPGVLLICAGFGAGTTAVSVANDLTSGVIDRFRSMGVRASTLVGGHVAASVARNAVSTAIVIGVAYAIGYRSDASVGQWVEAMGILVLFVFALSWCCAALGVVARSAEAANGLTFFVSFLPYLSSALVPIATMPHWLQGVARNQPLTPVIDSLRALLAGQSAGDDPWRAVVWSLALIAGAIALTGLLYRRRTTR